MRGTQFWRTTILVLVVGPVSVLGLASAGSGAVGAARAPGPDLQETASSATVTLVTGDVVRLDTAPDGTQHATVVRRVDPRGGYHTFTSGGDVHVEPGPASTLIAAGRLDPELFNVSSLVRQGYDDAHRATLPVIVEYTAAATDRAPLARKTAPRGATKDRVLESIDALAVSTAKAHAEQFWADVAGTVSGRGRAPARLATGLARVSLDFRVEATLDRSTAQIGAPEAWEAGLEGDGTTVAVLDTGIDATHPDFSGRIGATRDFAETGSVNDLAGHGTHVASIVAGSGAASDGAYRGVAPHANLMIGKVLNDSGAGAASWVIDGMEWASSNDADVVNMSLGGPVTKGDDPISRAVDELTRRDGTLFVVAAGNGSIGQPGTMDVTAPGAAASALTVGAVSRTDSKWSGSRNGVMGDGALKPDVMAPGMGIVAARAAGTGSGTSPYTSMTGTSMASPHVAGSAALLLQQHPDWTPVQVKAALTSTARPTTSGDAFDRGAGVIDVGRASRQDVYVDSGMQFMGYFARPFVDGQLTSDKQLNYTNTSDQDVTLDLSTTLVEDHGDPVDGDVLTVTPATLTVPAGGQAHATVHVDVSEVEAAEFSGLVVASGASGASGAEGLELRTTIGFLKQDDTVDVTFRAVDAHGRPATARLRATPYLAKDNRYYPDNIYLTGDQTEWTLRLPEGEYNLFGLITTFDASGRFVEEQSIVHDPKVSVQAPNSTVTLDARNATPVEVRTPRTSTPRELTMKLQRGEPGTNLATSDEWYWNYTDGEPSQVSVAPTEHVDDAPFALLSQWETGVPLLTSEVTGRGHHTVNAVQEGGPAIDGSRTLRVVDAGHATASDLRGLRLAGSVALVQESATMTWAEQVRAVIEAGAPMVMLYSAEDGVFYPWVGGPIPVLAVDRAEGERLRGLSHGHAPTMLRLTGTPRTPYAYGLTFVEQQEIPRHLEYDVRERDLATISSRFHTTGTGERGWRLRYGSWAPCACSTPTATDYVPELGYTRTEYVTADPDTSTYAAWQFLYNMPGDLLFARDRTVFRPGQKVTENWLAAPLSPGIANNTATPYNWKMLNERTAGGQLRFDLAGLTDSAGHWMKGLAGSAESLRLYRGDELLLERAGTLAGGVAVPGERATYRLEADTEHDGTVLGLSTRTRSVWTFGSAGNGAQQVLPLLDVDYPGITRRDSPTPALDLENTGRPGEEVTLHLKATHQRGSGAGEIGTMAVWVSYDDGATWTAAPTRALGDGEFAADYRHPRHGEFVSLKVRVGDRDGNTLEQSLVRAYRLGGR
ncbi:S8 family serine peptidase [Nocardioides sp. Root151]|uniref:S8 family serine peptidase n=1 Tax=Nocardioides sp. Root151 TaxID=1736475 RepID=UPI0007029585|nr:S8 family serine peptidase [Nocardioides sp. Root151]KQZ68612.1 hypothetical protein ASD66_15090 [Nocardioides sp. Root151]